MNKYYRKPAIRNGIVRVIFFLLVWLFISLAIEFFGLRLLQDLFPTVDQRSVPFQTITRSFSFLVTSLLIFIFRKWVDRRAFYTDWFSITSRKIDFVVGVGAGFLLMAFGAFVLGNLGYIEFSPGDITLTELAQYFLFFLVAAAWEEVVFRGYILENLMADMNKWIALVMSSIFFAILHLSNPNLEVIPVLNLFLAGLMLGASFIYTKNLWFPLGLHLGWNFFQAPIFGFEVSGFSTKSLYRQVILKDNVMVGGDFGFEGSILATALIVLSTFIIVVLTKKNIKIEQNEIS